LTIGCCCAPEAVPDAEAGGEAALLRPAVLLGCACFAVGLLDFFMSTLVVDVINFGSQASS
jgi:hypothetical protein